MPVDPGIYARFSRDPVRINTPFENLDRQLEQASVQALIRQRDASTLLERQKAQEEATFRQIMADTGGDWERAGPLVRQHAPSIWPIHQRRVEEARAVTTEIDKMSRDIELAQFQMGMRLLNASTQDAELYRQLEPVMRERLPSMANALPSPDDPDFAERLTALGRAGMTRAEQIKFEQEQAEFDRQQGERERAAREGEAIDVRGQDVSAQTQMRGQDISASTTRRGQDVQAATTRRGQDIDSADQRRGQNLSEGVETVMVDGKPTVVRRSDAVGKSPVPGTTAAGGKTGPDVGAIMGQIETLSQRINTQPTGPMSTVIGLGRRALAVGNMDNDVSEYESLVRGMIPMVARAVGHTGVLTQQDVDSVRALFPAVGDNATLAANKITRVKSLLAGVSAPAAQTPAPETPTGRVGPYTYRVRPR